MRDDERDGDANQQEHLANIAKSTHGAMSDHQKRRTIRALLCRLKWKNPALTGLSIWWAHQGSNLGPAD